MTAVRLRWYAVRVPEASVEPRLCPRRGEIGRGKETQPPRANNNYVRRVVAIFTRARNRSGAHHALSAKADTGHGPDADDHSICEASEVIFLYSKLIGLQSLFDVY